MSLGRRDLIKLASAAAVAAASRQRAFSSGLPAAENQVHFSGDGLELTPLEYSRLLVKLAEAGKIDPDNYSLGGAVEELELKFAKLLGKESAVFMPTGTLANHIAIRTLAGGAGKAVVQATSHIYNDSGDCLQSLSNLNLIPLAEGKAAFSLADVEQAVDRAASGRVKTKIGVISIESPVRRMSGETFDYGEVKKISQFARKNDIKLHLDGARLFLASPYTGVAPSEYALHFDTVYVSLYKYFNAASGAILAGPKELLKDLFHVRRMFGSGLPSAWPFAAVASHYADGFAERFAEAAAISEEVFKKLGARPEFNIERVPNGSNRSTLTVKLNETDANAYRHRSAAGGVSLSEPFDKYKFHLIVNESLRRIKPAEIADIFIRSLR